MLLYLLQYHYQENTVNSNTLLFEIQTFSTLAKSYRKMFLQKRQNLNFTDNLAHGAELAVHKQETMEILKKLPLRVKCV